MVERVSDAEQAAKDMSDAFASAAHNGPAAWRSCVLTLQRIFEADNAQATSDKAEIARLVEENAALRRMLEAKQ